MQFFKNTITLIFILFAIIACEKEIEIEVEDAAISLVIDAKVSNHPGDASVKLQYSQNLKDESDAAPISDAQVFIKDVKTNTTHVLTQVQEGKYTHPSLAGEIGHTYRLEVLMSDGTTYTAESTMPVVIPLDKVRQKLADRILQDDDDDKELYILKPEFKDLKGVDNYHEFFMKNKRTQEVKVNIFKDLGFDGLHNSHRIYVNLHPKDTVEMSLNNVDKNSYEYLFGMVNNINQVSGTPTNPTSNINGDALGFFKVYSYNKIFNVYMK